MQLSFNTKPEDMQENLLYRWAIVLCAELLTDGRTEFEEAILACLLDAQLYSGFKKAAP